MTCVFKMLEGHDRKKIADVQTASCWVVARVQSHRRRVEMLAQCLLVRYLFDKAALGEHGEDVAGGHVFVKWQPMAARSRRGLLLDGVSLFFQPCGIKVFS